MSSRSYREAIDCLNSLQSNVATLDALRASGGRMSDLAIPEMVEYLARIGYSTHDLNKLNVIHITGTKGKGSTSAFTDSILRHAKPDWKIGLYTSPHLVAVRERIRINGAPISEESFAQYFFEVWDRLDANTTRAHPDTTIKPAYFRFVTLVAYHAFFSQKVDATILEVGVGGRFDSTNIVPKPIVTGITALGLDHTAVLGKTIAEIAWQKAGIYKEGVPALSVNQPEEGMEVIKQEAANLKASEFFVVPSIPGLSDMKLGLAGKHQYQNASLAVYLAKYFLQAKGVPESELQVPESFVTALREAKWPGRCQTVPDPARPNVTWYLDGAHTRESLECCVTWFVDPDTVLRVPTEAHPITRFLIFNCTHGRSGTSLLGSMLAKLQAELELQSSKEQSASYFDHVVFCTNVTYQDGQFKGDLTAVSMPDEERSQLTTQVELAAAWTTLVPSFPSDRIHVLPSIEHAVNLVNSSRTDGTQIDVLVTGSLHLIGGIIEVAGLAKVALGE